MLSFSFKTRSSGIAAILAGVAAGCGGGALVTPHADSTSHTSKAGQAVLTYFGQPKPLLTVSSSEVTVLGQAGATFSGVTLEPPSNLDDTYMVYSRSVLNTLTLYKLNMSEGAPALLYQNNDGALLPGISAYGTITFDNVSFQMFNIRPDGTGLKPLTFGGVSAPLGAAYSLDGTNRIAFCDHSANLYVGPGSGGTPTLVQNNDVQPLAAWDPTSSRIAYSAKVGTSGNSDIYITSSSGGTTTDVTPTALQNTGALANPTWNADGVTIAAMYLGPTDLIQIVKFNITNPTAYTTLTPTGDYDQEPCFSPDGSKIAFYRENTNGAASGIYVADAAGANQSLLVPDPPDNENSVFGGIAWSPFLPKETVVAPSGSTFYHQAASGFLLTQNGDQFGSLVAFTANTPADAAIQAPSSPADGAPLVFTLTADSITSIGYINSYFNPGTTLSLTSTPAVVVSIDALTGQVDLVAPAAALAKPAKNPDGTVTYTAKFTAVYDGTGKNLAANGARQLVLNLKTGSLISIR